MSKFELGGLTVTSGVADRMETDKKFRNFVNLSLGRYINCAWGDVSEADRAQNNEAVENGEERIMGVYTHKTDDGTEEKIWIITEWDRSMTTILFPSEY